MRRPTALAVLGAAALLALSACAAPQAAPAVTVTETAEASVPSSSAEADTTPAYQAWATKARAPIAKWAKDWEDNTCTASAAMSGKVPLCQAQMIIADKLIVVFAKDLSGAISPSSADYLGAEPAALTSSVDAILSDAKAAAKHRDKWADDGCADSPDANGCLGTGMQFVSAMQKLDVSLRSIEK